MRALRRLRLPVGERILSRSAREAPDVDGLGSDFAQSLRAFAGGRSRCRDVVDQENSLRADSPSLERAADVVDAVSVGQSALLVRRARLLEAAAGEGQAELFRHGASEQLGRVV